VTPRERPIIMSGESVRALLAGTKTQTRRVMKVEDGKVRIRHSGAFLYLDFDGVPGLSWRPYGGAPTQPYPDPAAACPYGVPGDRLWCKESHWRYTGCAPAPSDFVQAPDGNPYQARCYDDFPGVESLRAGASLVRVPSIHMPRWASRLTLEVTEVRLQRLQEISEEDAGAEGMAGVPAVAWWQGYREIDGRLIHQTTRGEAPPGWMIEPHPLDCPDPLMQSARMLYADAWNRLNRKRSPWERNDWVFALTVTRLP
jgi:hypothetical protein